MIPYQHQYHWKQTTVVAIILVECACGIAQGETSNERSPQASVPIAEHAQVRLLTTASFQRAAYLSPVHDETLGRSVWMAPLVLQEIHSREGTPTFPEFGEVRISETEPYAVDPNRPAVYTTARRIRIRDRLYRQDSYLWFYPPAEAGGPLRYCGFRQTLGRNGFPAVRELISDTSTKRVFFVSKSIEADAARQFGDPLANRRYSVEPEYSEHSHVVVARVLPNGPQPMGPFVYIANASVGISNLKCRCEPAQVSEFTVHGNYRLVTVKSFSELPGKRPETQDVPLPDATHLDGVLRLPDSL